MTMTTERFNYIIDRIKQAKASGETDTKLGRVLAKWRDIDIPVGDGKGHWLLEGFIMTFKKDLEILNAIDPSVSPDVPAHLLDPAQIAYFFGIPLEDFSWQGQNSQQLCLNRIEAKLDRLQPNERKCEAEPEYLSLKNAAVVTGLSYSHVRRSVLSGELPASNNGTVGHPIYRIARTDLTAWMNNKKGGTANIPPRTELDELVNRHLPDLRGRKASDTR